MQAPEKQDSYAMYIISWDWHQQQGRSLRSLLKSRLSLIKGGKKTSSSESKNEKALIKLLQGQTPIDNPEFIRPDLPILEAVFRLFLVEGNRPLSLLEIQEKLMEWWKDVGAYKDAEPKFLDRLLSHDVYYGFQRVADEEES